MKTFKVIKDGKYYGHVSGGDIHEAVASAKLSIGYWVTHSHLIIVKYLRR